MVMKKLIVISVVFALVAGAAFAEINVGGVVFGKVNVMEGTNKKGIHPVTGPDADPKGATYLDDGEEVKVSGGFGRMRLEGSGQSDDGTFGGWLRFEANHDGYYYNRYGNEVIAFGLAWWQPIDLIKFYIGNNGGDGEFAKDGFVRWGWYRDTGDVLGVHNWDFGASFYAGFADGGAILTITPLEALAINIGIPYFTTNWTSKRGEDVYKSTNAQVSYAIDGIGDFAITYVGDYEGRDGKNTPNWKVNYGKVSAVDLFSSPTGSFKPYKAGDLGYVLLPPAAGSDVNDPLDSTSPPNTVGKIKVADSIADVSSNNNSKFYAFFNLSAIENLGLNFGVGFTLPSKDVKEVEVDPKDASKGKETYTVNYMPPVAIGLGVSYDMGAIGIKARVQGQFAESFKYDYEDTRPTTTDAGAKSGSYEVKGPFKLKADILPSFAINDSMKVFLSAGLELQAKYTYEVLGFDNADPDGVTTASSKAAKLEDTVESKVGWHVFPYFTKSVGWLQSFYVGFKLWHDAGDDYIDSYNRDSKGYLQSTWIPNYKPVVKWEVPIGIAFNF